MGSKTTATAEDYPLGLAELEEVRYHTEQDSRLVVLGGAGHDEPTC